MKRSRNENTSIESVIAWTPDEARSFFDYLDRIADDSVTQDEADPSAGTAGRARRSHPAFVA